MSGGGGGEVSLVLVPAARSRRPQALLYCTHAITGVCSQPLKEKQHPASRMAKMKKGKAHHWYKEEKDKVPKKSYVPTGENAD